MTIAISGGIHFDHLDREHAFMPADALEQRRRFVPIKPALDMAVDAWGKSWIKAIEIEADAQPAVISAGDGQRFLGDCQRALSTDLVGCDDAATETLDDVEFAGIDIASSQVHRALGIAQSTLDHAAKCGNIDSVHGGEHHAVEVS